jgi:hypothetical protein
MKTILSTEEALYLEMFIGILFMVEKTGTTEMPYCK